MLSTETALREWQTGSTQAERLAADVLRLEHFRNIEPQAPLGGGDEGADILCERGGRFWVCAVYFPPTAKDFEAVERKFISDLEKAKRHRRHGFVFFTNQRLTRGNRQTLSDIALTEKHECTIYDVERIRGVLDGAEGYGLRVSYLGIPMSTEDQIAFFARRENRLAELVSQNTDNMRTVMLKLEWIISGQQHVANSIGLLASAQNLTIEPLRPLDPLVIGEITSDGSEKFISQNFSPDIIRLVHRLVCFDLPSRLIGHFRTEQVFVHKAAAANEAPTFTPPSPAEVPSLIEELCSQWRRRISEARSPEDNLLAIAETFHRFLFIHPFLDGNGRVARSIMMQQCIELFGQVDMSRLDRGVQYYTALQSADRDDLKPLVNLIEDAIGTEN